MTEVEFPDGTIVEFPDGMDKKTIQKEAARFWAENGAKAQTESVETLNDGYSIVSTEDGRYLETPQGQRSPIEVDGDDYGGFLSRALDANPQDAERAHRLAILAERMTVPDDNGFASWLLYGNNRERGLGLYGNATMGVPFIGSWIDEALGGVTNAVGGDGEAARQRALDLIQAHEIAYPKTSTAAKVVGGLLPGLGAAKIAPRLLGSGSTLSKVSRGVASGAATGAVEGAVYGSGLGEEWSRVDNAKSGSLSGAAVGGGIGGALPIAGRLLRGPYAAAADKKLRSAARKLGMSQDVAGLVADRVQADAPYAIKNISKSGESATLGNLGPATRGLLDSVANAPGKSATIAHQGVSSIVDDVSERFIKTLDDVFGTSKGHKAIKRGVMDASRLSRKKAYDAAYSAPIDYASDAGARLGELLSRVDESIVKRAERLMRAEGASSKQIKATIDDAGNVVFNKMPDVRQIDYITRALKDASSFGSGLGQDEARAVKDLAREIRHTLDDIVPEYGQARSIAADAISERDAAELGKNMLKPSVTREDVILQIEPMGQAELVKVREGLRSQIDDAMDNVKRGLTRTDSDSQSVLKPLRDLTATSARKKVSSILGPDETKRLFAMLDEAEQVFSMRITTGSQTAGRLQTERAIRELIPQGIAEDIIDKGATGAISSAVGRAAQAGGKTQEQAMNEIRAYLAHTLTETGNVGSRVEKLNNFADLGRTKRARQAVAERKGQQIGAATSPAVIGETRTKPDNRRSILRRLADLGYEPKEIVNIMQSGQPAIRNALSR